MHSLNELKALIERSFGVLAFNGMFLVTVHGQWGMAGDEYYLNNRMITRKEIKKMFGE